MRERDTSVWRKAAAVAAALGCAGPAMADPLRDEATGLTIDAPEGYAATKIDGGPRYQAAYNVRKTDEGDPGCRVAFQENPQNADLTQDEINAFTAKPEWNDLIKATLALFYDVASVERFEHGGLAGAAVVGDVKPAEGAPNGNADMRSYFVLLDTPKGRTTVVCVGEKEGFDGRKAEFEAVARSIAPPR